MAAPVKKFSEEQVVEAIRASYGRLSKAAKRLGCSYTCINNYVKQSEYLQQAKRDIDESALDTAEDALMKKITQGHLGAICFFLKCQGKSRGYVERKELTGAEGQPIFVNIMPHKKEVKSTLSEG